MRRFGRLDTRRIRLGLLGLLLLDADGFFLVPFDCEPPCHLLRAWVGFAFHLERPLGEGISSMSLIYHAIDPKIYQLINSQSSYLCKNFSEKYHTKLPQVLASLNAS